MGYLDAHRSAHAVPQARMDTRAAGHPRALDPALDPRRAAFAVHTFESAHLVAFHHVVGELMGYVFDRIQPSENQRVDLRDRSVFRHFSDQLEFNFENNVVLSPVWCSCIRYGAHRDGLANENSHSQRSCRPNAANHFQAPCRGGWDSS